MSGALTGAALLVAGVVVVAGPYLVEGYRMGKRAQAGSSAVL